MQIKRSVANQVFVDLGFKADPSKWSDEKITSKLNRLPDLVESTPDVPEKIIDDPDHIVNKICKAVNEDKEKIELITETAKEGETKMTEETTKKKTKKEKKNKVYGSIKEYETGVPDKKAKKGKKETTTEEKKDKDKKKDKKDAGEKKESNKKKVGVVSVIVESLRKGKFTTEQIHEKLVEKFPDRDAKGMKGTISSQISYMKTKGAKIEKDDKGRWIMSKEMD